MAPRRKREFRAAACDNGAVILQPIAKFILKICGWTPVGTVPDFNKIVFIAAPHTSNWDGFWLIVYKNAMNLKIRFLAKHTLFWWPMGSLLRWFEAIPVDRSHASSTVQQLIDAFAKEEHLFLALAPEGTRKRMPYWKTGFYQIAKEAKIPIALGYIDYKQKKLGIGITLHPSGDIDKDLSVIRGFYEPIIPRHPHLKSPVAFPPIVDDAETSSPTR